MEWLTHEVPVKRGEIIAFGVVFAVAMLYSMHQQLQFQREQFAAGRVYGLNEGYRAALMQNAGQFPAQPVPAMPMRDASGGAGSAFAPAAFQGYSYGPDYGAGC